MATTTRKMAEDPVIQCIVGLVREKEREKRTLRTMSKWKYDGSYVYIKCIEEICEFLDTTPNYLFFGSEDEEERLSLTGKEIIRMYRSLDNGKKKCIQKH